MAFDRMRLAHRYALLVTLTGSIFLPLYHPRTVLTPRPIQKVGRA